MGPFDFFIAYAGPDRKQARKLKWSLEDEHCQVFMDEAGLPPGIGWPSGLQEALEASHAVLVLISSHSDRAFYQREEIVRAIQMARDDPQAHRVIPVLLDQPTSVPSTMPYGTGILQAIDGTRSGGLKRVAQELVERMDEWQRAAPPQVPISAVEYHAFGAALRLDRSPQWAAVLEESQRPGHVLFLLHGPRHENVGLFIARIQHFFSQEVERPHAIYWVPLKQEGVSARCGADWQRHLRFALGGEGDAHQLLAQVTHRQAVFLILGLQPLDLALLDEEIRSGLREFLVQRLPSLVGQARLQHSVRVLLAIDYAENLPSDGTMPVSVERADRWGRETAASGQLRYCPLPPAELPPWHDVALYLSKKEPPPSPATAERLHAEYERLTSGQRISYRELTDMIDRYLAEA